MTSQSIIWYLYLKNLPKPRKKMHKKYHSLFCGVWALTSGKTLHVRWITCLLQANWRARVKKIMRILHIEAVPYYNTHRPYRFNYSKCRLLHICMLILHSFAAFVLDATLRKSNYSMYLYLYYLSVFLLFSVPITSYCTNCIISYCIIRNSNDF